MLTDPIVIGFLVGLGMCAAVAVFAALAWAVYVIASRAVERARARRFAGQVDRLEERLAVEEATRVLEGSR